MKTNYVINELPVGTMFIVINGQWRGEITESNGTKHVKMKTMDNVVVDEIPAENNNMGWNIKIAKLGK